MAEFTLQQLLAALQAQHASVATETEHFILQQAQLVPLHGGNNTVYAASWSGTQLVLKVYKVDQRRRAQKEWAALRLLEASGCDFAPRLIACAEHARAPAAALTLLPGNDLGNAVLKPQQLGALAETLCELDSVGKKQTAESVDSNTATRLATLWHEVQELPTATGTGYMRTYVDRLALEAAGEARDLWARWARSLDVKLLEQPAPAVFSRGDPNLANCLWDGVRMRIVDYEYAGLSDRAFDLADLIEHPQSRNTPEEGWHMFVDLFRMPAWEMRRLEAARRMLAMFWVLKFAQFGADDARFVEQVRRAKRLQVTGDRL